jgi:erythromycin esterase
MSSAPIDASSIDLLKRHAVPFRTAEFDSNRDDISALKDMIGTARIVALGEATHGTHEFFSMKHRIVDLLVSDMGFNTFAIEASWQESRRIDEYIHSGEGDLDKFLGDLHFWTWNTDEVYDMIRWMRRHNESHDDIRAVSFHGIDIQHPLSSIDVVLRYLARLDTAAHDAASQRYALFRSHLSTISTITRDRAALNYAQLLALQNYSRLSGAIKRQCRQSIISVFDDLSYHRSLYESRSSRQEFAQVLQSARMVILGEALYSAFPVITGRQWLDLARVAVARLIRTRMGTRDDVANRDAGMAETVSWIVNQMGPSTKAIIWAHNGHVMARAGSMGGYLRRRYGSDVVIIGFTCYRGRFIARTLGRSPNEAGPPVVHEVDVPPNDSYEAAFHAIGMPRFMVDMRKMNELVNESDWTRKRHPLRMIGGGYSEAQARRFFYPALLTEEVDVMIYFEETSPSQLRW